MHPESSTENLQRGMTVRRSQIFQGPLVHLRSQDQSSSLGSLIRGALSPMKERRRTVVVVTTGEASKGQSPHSLGLSPLGLGWKSGASQEELLVGPTVSCPPLRVGPSWGCQAPDPLGSCSWTGSVSFGLGRLSGIFEPHPILSYIFRKSSGVARRMEAGPIRRQKYPN